MHSRFCRSLRWLGVLAFSCGGLLGCGGGGEEPRSEETPVGRLVVTIEWPGRQAFIPAAAACIKATLSDGGQVLGEKIIPRPTGGGRTQAALEGLPQGDWSLTAAAYPNVDATGVAQAQSTVPISIRSGETAALTVSLTSTIDHMELYPQAPAPVVGQIEVLNAVAKNAAGDIVLTWPSKLTWTSANPSFATVASPGIVTGVAPTGTTPGPVRVTVTDTESGKSASVPVTVTSNATVAISPSSAVLSTSETLAFTATVSNAADTSVTWSVQEGEAGGSITSAGLYTAPAVRGAYHVVATSRYDTSKKASVAVTVQAGSADVILK